MESRLADGVALLQRLGDGIANRAARCAVRILPIQAVLFSRSTEDSLRVLIYSGIIVNLQSIFLLGIHKTTADLKGVQFVGANPAKENFLPARLGFEIPFAILLDQRNRHGPLFLANNDDCPSRFGRVDRYGVLGTSLCRKRSSIVFVFDGIGRGNEVLAVWSEDCH